MQLNIVQMSIFISYDRLLVMLRIWGVYTAIWPLDFKDEKLKIFFYQIFWCVCLVHMTNQCYFLIKNIFLSDQGDFVNTMKTMVELIFSVETVFNLLYCKIRRQQLQVNTVFLRTI